MTESASHTTHSPYAAWRTPSYRFYAIGWFLLIISNQILTVAVGIRLYAQTSDPLALGFVGLVQALPVLLLAVGGGHIADRFDRRRVIVLMQIVSTCTASGLALAARQDAETVWFYLLLGIGAIGQALGGPSRAALLPQIVPAEHFSNAMTWSTTIFHVASMAGPAVGGILVGYDTSATTAFVVAAVCRVLSVVAILGIAVRPVERLQESISLQNLIAGFRFVWQTKVLLAAMTLDLLAVLVGGLTYLLPIFAKDILELDSPEDAVGFLRSAEAVGAVVMALVLAHLPPIRRAGPAMLWAVAGFGAATIVFGLSESFALSLVMMFLIGAFDNISVVVRHTLVQCLTPDAMRGRVSAVNGVFIVASNDLGGFESGVAARLFGPVIAVVAGGVGAIAVVLGIAKVSPELRRIGSLADLKPATAADTVREGP